MAGCFFPKTKAPANLADPEKGKLFGSAKNLLETWKWLMSCLCNCRGGQGLIVEQLSTGQPQLNVLIEAGDGLKAELTDKNYWKISLKNSNDDGDDDDDSRSPKSSGGGQSSGYGAGDTPGTTTTPNPSTVEPSGGSSDDKPVVEPVVEPKTGKSTCNEWSYDVGNPMYTLPENNNEDNCKTLNGWS